MSWWERTFEIQIQPLQNFYKEREHFSKESHAGFKTKRESIRDQVAEQIPLMRFYRDLLQYVFAADRSSKNLPSMQGISVLIEA